MDEIFDEWKEAKPQTPDFGYRLYFDEWRRKMSRFRAPRPESSVCNSVERRE